MKGLIVLSTLLVLLASPSRALANRATCDEIKSDLLAIQDKLESTRPRQCSKVGQLNCCDPSEPASCKSMAEAQNEYNDAVARLTIIEGLIAITQTMENSHNSLRNLKESDVNKAVSDLETFNVTFERARFIEDSLILKDNDSSIWDNYEGKNITELRSYLNEQCAVPKEQIKFTEFCTRYLKHDKLNAPRQFAELLETLQGFAAADRRVITSDRRTVNDTYRKYFDVNIDGTLVPLAQLDKRNHFAPVVELEKLIKQYQNSKSKKDPALLSKIIEVSKTINELDVNFNNAVSLPAKFQNFAAEKLEKNLLKLKSASGVFLRLNETRTNFQSVKKSVDVDVNAQENSVYTEAQEFVNRHMKDCSGDPLVCIEKICGTDPSSGQNSAPACIQNSSNQKYFGMGINNLHSRIKNLRKSKQLGDALGELTACLDQDFEEVKKCLADKIDKLSIDIKSSLKDARQKVADAKKVLNHNLGAKNIDELEQLKVLAVMQLKKMGCGMSAENTENLNSTCNSQPLAVHGKAFVQFETEVGDALVAYNDLYLAKLYKDNQKHYKPVRDSFIEACGTDIKYSHLCRTLKSEKLFEERKVHYKVDPIVAKHMQYDMHSGVRYKPNNDERNAAIWRGIGTVAVMGVTQGLQAKMQYDATQDYLDGWRRQSEWNAYWNDYYRNNPPTTYISTWGMDYWSPYAALNFNYQTSNDIYYQHIHHDFNQLNFPPSTVSPIGGSSSGSYQFNFSI